jgi:serine/threonine-protein kinase
MSPEQLRSAKLVDVRTDIWALGVILYETLTGRVPFVAETVTQLTAMVLQDPPRPISELRADLPPGLSRVIERCLAKAPGERFGSVAELAQALDGFGSVPGAARRIAEVTGSLSRVPLALGSSAGKLATGGTGSTSVAWGETQLATPRRSRGALVAMALGLVTLVVLVVGVTFAVRALRSPAAATVPPVEVVPTTRQIELAAPAPSIAPAASVPPLAAPAPSAPSPPVAAPSGRAPAPRPRPAAPPKLGKPSDDMPNERN